jgi:hypothetical protein
MEPAPMFERSMYEPRVAEPVVDVFFEDERSPSCDIVRAFEKSRPY